VKQRILQMPHPKLREVAAAIPAELLPEHVAAIQDLRDTFAETQNCIGLAATQLGIMWRVIIVDVSPSRGETYVMVNPVITKASDDCQLVNDGCKSIFEGNKRASTKRPKRLTVEWTDPRGGERRKMKFVGLLAAAIHHEIDHLDGVMFVDRIVDGAPGAKAMASLNNTPTAAKGDYYGECNRTACDNTPATCFNESTKKFYCIPCARRINEVNGTQLCAIGEVRDEQ
jgi:peptide deformylase